MHRLAEVYCSVTATNCISLHSFRCDILHLSQACARACVCVCVFFRDRATYSVVTASGVNIGNADSAVASGPDAPRGPLFVGPTVCGPSQGKYALGLAGPGSPALTVSQIL